MGVRKSWPKSQKHTQKPEKVGKKHQKMNKINQFFIVFFNILVIFVLISFNTQIHNIDIAFNSFKENSTKCDYINTNECRDLKEIYINSLRNARYLFISAIILLIISFNILIIKYSKNNEVIKMKKKGQAMEFLMTYGWAILVVLGAIAVLAGFGLLDPTYWERPDYKQQAIETCNERNKDLFLYEETLTQVRFICKNVTQNWDFIYNKTDLIDFIDNKENKSIKDLKPNKSI